MKGRKLFWMCMFVFLSVVCITCGVTIVESSKVSTVNLVHQATYNPPENIPVTAYANGGTFSPGNTYNTYITFDMIVGNSAVPTPTRTGYALNGWEYSVDNVTYTDYSNISDSIPFTEHLYLRAKWNANSYSVTLNKQSGSGGTNSITATYGSDMPSATMPTRTGYTFGGYYSGTNGSGNMYYTSNGASNRTWDSTTISTLYAKWTGITYYVRFNSNGGSGSMSNQTFTYGTNQNLTSNSFTKTDYTFNGWNTQANGSGTSYTDGQSVGNLSTSNGATIDLYAQWTASNSSMVTLSWQIDNNISGDNNCQIRLNGFSGTRIGESSSALSSGSTQVESGTTIYISAYCFYNVYLFINGALTSWQSINTSSTNYCPDSMALISAGAPTPGGTSYTYSFQITSNTSVVIWTNPNPQTAF